MTNNTKAIWAIARNQLVEFWRMRALVGIIALLILCFTVLFAAWLYKATDRTDQQVQTFLSYSLGCMITLQSLVTIFISILSVTRDIKGKEIFTVLTKPVRRFEFLLGKFAGVCLINLILLLITGGLIYGLAWYPLLAMNLDDNERNRLEELVLIARQSVKPLYPDVTREVNLMVEKQIEYELKTNPLYQNQPDVIANMRKMLQQDYTLQKMTPLCAVSPNNRKSWKFSGLAPMDRQKGYIFIRYKKNVSRETTDLKTTDYWGFGPKDPLEFGGKAIPPVRNTIRTVHEFPIPVGDLSAEGDLWIAYGNPAELNEGVSVLFPGDTGLEALYVSDTFLNNYLRSLLLIYLRLVFLAALGVAMGAWLSFPVAVLLVMVVFVFGISSGFITDAMEWNAGDLRQRATALLLAALPRFSRYDPVSLIQSGRMVGVDLIGQCLLYMMLIKGGLLALFGYAVFKFREMARVIA